MILTKNQRNQKSYTTPNVAMLGPKEKEHTHSDSAKNAYLKILSRIESAVSTFSFDR